MFNDKGLTWILLGCTVIYDTYPYYLVKIQKKSEFQNVSSPEGFGEKKVNLNQQNYERRMVLTHFMRVCVCSVVQSCLTLCRPVNCSPPGSSVSGISQARILEWVAISFSMRPSQPRDQTQVSCIGSWILYH